MSESVEKSEHTVEYASFHARVLAVTLDVFVAMMLLLPLVTAVGRWLYPKMEMRAAAETLATAVMAVATGQMIPAEAIAILQESGALSRWMFDNMLQIILIGILVVFCWNRWMASPGMWLLRLQIRDGHTLSAVSLSRLIWRYIVCVLGFLPFMLGFLWILFDKKNRAWQDLATGTVVVKKAEFSIDAV